MSEKVLLIDDEIDFLEAMSERMTARGMAVSTASSADEAIKIIETASFDAIILDFQMPGMDGMEALKTIKEKRPDSDLEALSQKIKKAKARRMLIVEKQQAKSVLDALKKYGI
jgi:two-component system response regulator RegA